MPIWERFTGKGKKPVKGEEFVPPEEIVLVPEFATDPEMDAFASKVEELSQYRVAAFMDGGQVLKDKVATLEAEVNLLMQERGKALDTYLAPYLELVLDLRANKKDKPFPMSQTESMRFHAAQSLLVQRGQLK